MEKLLINKKAWIGGLVVAIVIILLVCILLAYPVLYALASGEEKITIKEKWVKVKGDDAKYLLSSNNGQVFQITDTIFKWRFDSSNLYAELDEGDTCDIKTQGWRFGLLSDYKNIIEANCD